MVVSVCCRLQFANDDGHEDIGKPRRDAGAIRGTQLMIVLDPPNDCARDANADAVNMLRGLLVTYWACKREYKADCTAD